MLAANNGMCLAVSCGRVVCGCMGQFSVRTEVFLKEVSLGSESAEFCEIDQNTPRLDPSITTPSRLHDTTAPSHAGLLPNGLHATHSTTGLAPHIELRICCSCEMHSFSFAFEDLSTGGGGGGARLAAGGGGARLAAGGGGARLATGLGGGGGGLATGLGRGFFWMFFGSIFGLGAALAGAFLAGAAFFGASSTLAEGILMRPRPLLRSESAEGGGAGMKRTFFFSFSEGDLAFVMVFFGGAAFFGGGNVVFKAKMGAGEAGLAGALAAAFLAAGLAAAFFAGGAFFAGAAFFPRFAGAGLPIILLRNSVAN